MGRAPCCDKAQVKKGPWSPEEDTKLKEFIEKYGTGGNWIALPHKAGLKRCGKSCRLRWLNYLRPNIKHGDFSDDEDSIICSLFASFGSRWSIIAAQLPGRTDNDIKNYWNTKLKKKLLKGMMLPSYTPPSFPPFLQSSPSPSTSTYKSSNGIYYPPSKSLTDLEQPTSNPSYLFNNSNSSTTITSLLFSQENLVGPIHQYQGKDSLLMFGSGHEPSSSSSDGSCNQISYVKDNNEYDQYGGDQQTDVEKYFYNGVEEKHKFMIGDRWTTERSNGFLGENSSSSSSEYSLEEIKQLVSSNGCNSFFMDETKAHGRDVYYY